jgi:ATP-dependent helicase/nuclease subunit B
MDGLVLDDPDVISAMDHDGKGEYVPVVLKGGIPDKKDHVVSPKELESVMKYLKELIADMVQELRKGDISAMPLNGTRVNACEWCPYRSVCGHEKDDPAREMQDWDRDAAMKELEQAKRGDEET